MRKCWKILSTAIICLIPVALITYFAVPWNSTTLLSLVGSSSLQPLMNELSNVYKAADFIVQGGGSGFGIKSIATNTTNIGLSSKDPYLTIKNATVDNNGFTKDDWNNLNIKTFTIAFDNIAVIYKADDKKDILNIDQSNIYDIYSIFAGTYQCSLSNLIANYNGVDKNSVFLPYSRTGGSNTSGTASTFLEQFQDFNWDSEISQHPDYQKTLDILNSGDYQGNVRSTNESNVETWNKVSEENKDGAITYLSLSFVIENYDLITKSGYIVATVNGIDPYQYYLEHNKQLDTSFLKNYKWFSVYNLMVCLNNMSDAIKDFIGWIYFNQTALNLIDKLALVPVGNNLEYLKSMLNSKYSSIDKIDESNFLSIFFNPDNSDFNILFSLNTNSSMNNLPENAAFGISNQTVLNSGNNS
ncbi:MAG: PstS family phosphate ABC transporter substrate-binding protein [Malacoplasma sp.]|nr:PstS family phosphate ABC transporter substrate-binding protein [Malacoplasma sp.]